MKKMLFYALLYAGVNLILAFAYQADALDKVSVYRNDILVDTWRADPNIAVRIDKIAVGDTLIFKARSDAGGLSNSSIDIKDDRGELIENIQSPNRSTEYAANFTYVFSLKKIDTSKTLAVQVFLNLDPVRNVPPPTVASITIPKK